MNSIKQPLVTVVIPTYKRPEMIEGAITTVESQTYPNIEIIVVDDNQENSEYRGKTEIVMKKYENNDNIIYIKNKKNLGGSESRNVGIKAASGEYISFLDDDDEYENNKIEKQMSLMHTSDLDNLAFVYCQTTLFDNVGNAVGVTNNFYRGNKTPFYRNLMKCIAGTPTILAKRSVLEEIDGFKTLSSGQDWYLILEILEKGYNIDYLKESLVKVNLHDNERISNKNSKIESLNNEIFEIKKIYLSKVPKKISEEVLYYHNMQLANIIKHSSKRKSLVYFLKALKYRKAKIKNLIFIGTLFVKKNTIMKIKMRIYKITKN